MLYQHIDMDLSSADIKYFFENIADGTITGEIDLKISSLVNLLEAIINTIGIEKANAFMKLFWSKIVKRFDFKEDWKDDTGLIKMIWHSSEGIFTIKWGEGFHLKTMTLLHHAIIKQDIKMVSKNILFNIAKLSNNQGMISVLEKYFKSESNIIPGTSKNEIHLDNFLKLLITIA